nr:interferon regulatory factor 3 isoform X1 [Anolis sagrei ordinatus]XP_060636760.1 interferon regulatory factor 3 isoform X1 [Anolis sagrei ordinatus]
MGAQRPLIVPWLIEQLDAQRYPGVSWLNPERTQFRVPWKHGGRQNISDEDFQLFEDWAIARGRYRPGIDRRTPSEWKRNFRAALNRKDGIEKIQDNSTDSEDPHVVFEIKQPNGASQSDSAGGTVNTAASDISSVASGSTSVPGDFSSCSQDELRDNVLSGLDLPSSQEEDPNWCGILSPTAVEPSHSAGPFEQVLGASAFVVGTEYPVCSGTLSQPSLDLTQQTVMVQPLQLILEAPTLATDFEVRIYYRGRQVLNEVFSNVRGLCFLPPGCSGSNPDFADVIFPSPENLNDHLQVSYSQRLIQEVAPGVFLGTEGQSLCGMRRGHCRIYWGQSEFPTEGMLHGELPKEQLGPMYSLQQFVHELIGFMEGRNGSPNYSLWLCFGEQWPDTNRPWKKKLIMVEVIPKVFELLHELSKARGASSLGEPDLRISDASQEPCFLEQLRSWEEKMDVQCS